MLNLRKNKRANIPVTILVLGVVVLCILTIYSFYLAHQNATKNFSDVSLVQQAKIQMEKIIVEKELGLPVEQLPMDTNAQEYYLEISSKTASVKYFQSG